MQYVSGLQLRTAYSSGTLSSCSTQECQEHDKTIEKVHLLCAWPADRTAAAQFTLHEALHVARGSFHSSSFALHHSSLSCLNLDSSIACPCITSCQVVLCTPTCTSAVFSSIFNIVGCLSATLVLVLVYAFESNRGSSDWHEQGLL